MDRKRKFGWSGYGIVGMIFLPMGLFFIALGLLLWRTGAGDTETENLILLCVLGGQGVIFALAGAICLMKDIRRRRGMQEAIDQGYYILAKVAGTTVQTNVSMNGRHPCVVECQAMQDGVLHIYRSRYLYFDPTAVLDGREVKVYINRNDPKQYYVDIDELLPEVVIH